MELRARFSLLDRLLGGFGLHASLCRGTVLLSQRYPRPWLAVTVMAAGIGYAFIFLFPYLLVATSEAIYPTLTALQTPQDWLNLAQLVCTQFIAIAFTYTLYTMRFTPPDGRILTEQEAPLLFRLLEQLRQAYGNPRIDCVMLDEGDDVRIVKTPRNGFPVLFTTTLIIGLPLLHTVSPLHLRVLMARRIGQLSGRHNLITGWLYHLKAIWSQYRDQRRGKSLPSRIIGYFFALYAPVYNTVALGVSRREELNADRYAHDIINGQEVAETISFHAASRDFLAFRYWPTMKRMAARAGGKPDYLPYQHMTTVMRSGMATGAPHPVSQRYSHDDDFTSGIPTLDTRLDNLGHNETLPQKELKATAVQAFLKDSHAAIAKTFHRRWLGGFRRR